MADMTAEFGAIGVLMQPLTYGAPRVIAGGEAAPMVWPASVQMGYPTVGFGGDSPNRDAKIIGTTVDPEGPKQLPVALRQWGRQAVIQYGYSGAGGVFRFHGLPPGEYEVLVGGAPGYRTKAFGPITVSPS